MAKQDACLFSWLGVNWETNTGKKGAVLRAYVGTKTRKGKISAEQKWHHLLLNTYWSEGNSPIFIRLTDLENSPYCSIKPRRSQILSPKEKFWPVPLCPRECQFVINCVKSLPLAVVWGPLTRSGSCWLPEVGKETPASSPTQKIVTSVKPCAAPYCTECLHWKGFDFAKSKLAPCSHQTELFWPLRTFHGLQHHPPSPCPVLIAGKDACSTFRWPLWFQSKWESNTDISLMTFYRHFE